MCFILFASFWLIYLKSIRNRWSFHPSRTDVSTRALCKTISRRAHDFHRNASMLTLQAVVCK